MNLIVNYGASSIKLFLVILFFILGMGEFMDGVYDVGDYAVPLLLCLLLNDLYINYINGNSKKITKVIKSTQEKTSLHAKCYRFLRDLFYSGSSENMTKNEKGLKIIMNNVFLILFLSPLIMSDLHFEQEIKSNIFKLGVVVWSGVFLAVSLNDFRHSLKFQRLIFSNMAFLILIGSLILL